MIQFITNRDHDTGYERAYPSDLLEYCQDKPTLALDCEFNRLDPHTAVLLMVIIGDAKRSYVIDATSVDISFLTPLKDKLFVGHNIKIDYCICKVNGFTFTNIFDTMVAEQRLGLGSGRKNGLAPTLERRFNIPMEKDTREEFISMTSKSIYLDHHLEYAANDTRHLLRLMELQSRLITKFDMGFLLYDIEFPLVITIGNCELEGFVLNTKEWKFIMAENKAVKNSLVDKMDQILADTAKSKRIERTNKVKEQIHNATMAKYTKPRNRTVTEQGDFFRESKFTETESQKAVKYSSDKQMKQLFKDFGEHPPVKSDKETVAVPMLEAYLISNPQSILAEFLRTYIEHSAIQKQLSTYGQSFLDMINPITGKIHTTFRLCATDTGRFSSGDVRAGFPNLQNIPADIRFRHCFGVEEGYEVTTCDLSGAELIVMVALSNDLRLLELASGDMHSHMANLCWKPIIEDRGEEFTEDMIVSKKQNKDKRTGFKPMTFGTIYGMYAGKAAEQLNVTKEEGEIVIKMIKKEIPDVFKMVESASKFAMKYGYVVHNKRTNSRRWFTPVLEAKKYLKQMQKEDPLESVPGLPFYVEYRNAKPEHLMEWDDIKDCASPARNTRIQG